MPKGLSGAALNVEDFQVFIQLTVISHTSSPSELEYIQCCWTPRRFEREMITVHTAKKAGYGMEDESGNKWVAQGSAGGVWTLRSPSSRWGISGGVLLSTPAEPSRRTTPAGLTSRGVGRHRIGAPGVAQDLHRRRGLRHRLRRGYPRRRRTGSRRTAALCVAEDPLPRSLVLRRALSEGALRVRGRGCGGGRGGGRRGALQDAHGRLQGLRGGRGGGGCGGDDELGHRRPVVSAPRRAEGVSGPPHSAWRGEGTQRLTHPPRACVGPPPPPPRTRRRPSRPARGPPRGRRGAGGVSAGSAVRRGRRWVRADGTYWGVVPRVCARHG